MRYVSTEGDEVEDLRALLKGVLGFHPRVQYVSSGAIKSTYQRERVENICEDLGLISLSFLWMRPQKILLKEMVKMKRI